MRENDIVERGSQTARVREKKPGPLTGLTPEQRLDRYATLFRFTTEQDIDSNKLANQWDVDVRGIAAMINQAKNNEVLYHDLRALGYADDEFPDWWFSPARSSGDELDDTRTKVIEPDEHDVKDDGTDGTEGLTAPPPRTPAPRGPGPGRPALQVQSVQINQEQPQSDQITPDQGQSTEFTENEINLLGSHSIVRGDDGIWKHIENEPSGRTIITPVNPIAELQRISSQSQGDAILRNVNKNMIEQLEISTQAIIKKVALNPTVFWLFQYVTSIRDKSTGLPLFVGDIGDFLSFCARFTGEAYYGVVPTYVTNRPSFLTSLNQQQQRSTYAGQPQLTYNQLLSARREEERTQ